MDEKAMLQIHKLMMGNIESLRRKIRLLDDEINRANEMIFDLQDRILDLEEKFKEEKIIPQNGEK